MNTNITKTMPPVTGNSNDRTSTFVLGRRAFFNETYKSYISKNLPEFTDYSSIKDKKTNISYAKPLNNQSGDLRIQRLRLNAIGSGSSKLKNGETKLQFNKGPDNNLKNSLIYVRVRGSGGGRPKR
jgi:protein subunit release factor A